MLQVSLRIIEKQLSHLTFTQSYVLFSNLTTHYIIYMHNFNFL